MTDHLPECLNDDATYGLRGLCICEELRACKQRVLDAAREEISKIPKEDGGYCHVLHACDIEAAIDALREKP